MESKSKEQLEMEELISKALFLRLEKSIPWIFQNMLPQYRSCCYEKKELVMAYPVQEWELNPLGGMHGGIITTIFDTSMGMLSHYCAKGNMVATVSLQTTYLKPVPHGETFVVKVNAVSDGRRLVTLNGEGYLEGSGKLAAVAVGTFIKTSKEMSR